MPLDPDVQKLADLFDAGSDAFNRKDVDGYLSSAHPLAWTHQGGTFMSVEALRAVAPAVLESSERFEVTDWQGGVVVGDTGVAWGEFEFVAKDGAGGTTTSTGKFLRALRAGRWIVVRALQPLHGCHRLIGVLTPAS